MTFTELSNRIFDQAISDYHTTDNVDAPIVNPYAAKSIEFYLYLKNWIDTVQWHLEDIIRDPHIDPGAETPYRQIEPRPHRPCGTHR